MHKEFWDALMVIAEVELQEAVKQDELDWARLRGEPIPAKYTVKEAGLHEAVDADVQMMLAGGTSWPCLTPPACVECMLRCLVEQCAVTCFMPPMFVVCCAHSVSVTCGECVSVIYCPKDARAKQTFILPAFHWSLSCHEQDCEICNALHLVPVPGIRI